MLICSLHFHNTLPLKSIISLIKKSCESEQYESQVAVNMPIPACSSRRCRIASNQLSREQCFVCLYYYRRVVHKNLSYTNLSSKFDRFLAGRSQFDTDHGVDFNAHTCCLSATFVRPLFAFVLCFFTTKNHK